MRTPGRPFTKNDPRINKRGRPKGSISFNDEVRRFARMSPEHLRKVVNAYAAAMKTGGPFPKEITSALSVGALNALMSGWSQSKWRSPEFAVERIEPSKLQVEHAMAEPLTITVRHVDARRRES